MNSTLPIARIFGLYQPSLHFSLADNKAGLARNRGLPGDRRACSTTLPPVGWVAGKSIKLFRNEAVSLAASKTAHREESPASRLFS
jgi:hypothetical protein